MKKNYYRKLNEQVVSHISPNGLTSFILPKKGFHRAYAMLAINYGSIDAEFTIDNELHTPPKGVAHFLEHKVFEQPDGGNALQIFSRTGALPNAFTSKTMTAYHFSCTENFYRNLEILLDFVTTPYFTDDNVKKEQGIITQEIGMVNDKPGWRVFENLMASLYSAHPARDSIIGTRDSISQITRKVLFDCYNTFYIPSNMVLTVAGDVDAEKVITTAESILPKGFIKPPKRHYKSESSDVTTRYIEKEMETPIPVFSLGFRIPCKTNSLSGMRARAISELTAEVVAGDSSPLYSSLYSVGLINNSFGAGVMIFPESLCMMFSGESYEPEKVRDAIIKASSELCLSLDNGYFNRVKKSYYGMALRSLDSLDSLCREQASAFFNGYMYYDLINEFENVGICDIIGCIKDVINESNMSLSVISQNKGPKE